MPLLCIVVCLVFYLKILIQEPGRNVVVSSCIEKTPNNNHTESMKLSSKVSSERGKVIILLKQEMESALVSLREVQVEMAKLQGEKEELKASEKRSLSNLNNLAAQFCNLETVMKDMEEQYEHRMEVTDHKLKASNCLFLSLSKFFFLVLSHIGLCIYGFTYYLHSLRCYKFSLFIFYLKFLCYFTDFGA